ncbi:hypothetical protein AAFF_G00183780 [Aldrovandia affinis]|uniref:Uncharacterized protein n=1 Tax=Aldrovandia affinis TaxID=143900 RepID=A0AAD7W6Y2_9TELE|nr:hypothetical protein AAFF_G00183780 [Aldrovandia affinis]
MWDENALAQRAGQRRLCSGSTPPSRPECEHCGGAGAGHGVTGSRQGGAGRSEVTVVAVASPRAGGPAWAEGNTRTQRRKGGGRRSRLPHSFQQRFCEALSLDRQNHTLGGWREGVTVTAGQCVYDVFISVGDSVRTKEERRGGLARVRSREVETPFALRGRRPSCHGPEAFCTTTRLP